MIRVYASDETNFNSNGLGVLRDVISCYVYEELNGQYYLELEYPNNNYLCDALIERNVIKCNVGYNNNQLFRITLVEKNDKTTKITAFHIFYDLSKNMLVNVAPTELDAQGYGQWILSKTDYATPFTFTSDISGSVASGRYIRKTPTEAIMDSQSNGMIAKFGGELVRDNFSISLQAHRGTNRGVKLLYGKNIKAITYTTDVSNLVTRALPVAFDGLQLPEVFIDSPNINLYENPIIAVIEMQDIVLDETGATEGSYLTQEACFDAMRQRVQALYNSGLDTPKINVSVDWLELSKTIEYQQTSEDLERVFLGDTVTLEWGDYFFQTKVVSSKFDSLLGRMVGFELGSLSDTLSSVISGVERISGEKSDGARELAKSLTEQAREMATEQITQAMGGYVYKTNNELYIMDTDNPSTALKVWRWNLNGLGYSSTGIQGPYIVAMTQDGSINADMITAGTIRTDRIEGYGNVVVQVGNTSQFVNTHFRFDGDGLHIIGDDNGSELLLKGDKISFLDDTTYITGDYLYTKNLNVEFSLGTNHYEFKERTSGDGTHFSLFYKG